MKFKIIPSKLAEANELLKIQKEAFHSDLIKYKDYQTSPATESLDFFFFRMQNSLHYSILVEGRLAGGICLVKQSKDHHYLYRIFLGSEFQNKGLGSKILHELERQFPKVKKWSLDTPKDNHRNRHFYEKFGYKKIGEQQINEYLTLINYEKIL
ncbi:GNAT family N-acetyltransferase [Bacillus sp. FJAT-29953]|nr:GNAT family N-acetyltransferase [Bacillus sp. FJAT-29953]